MINDLLKWLSIFILVLIEIYFVGLSILKLLI